MNKVRVECRHIGLAYGSTEVLKDVNVEIEPGEFFALLGPSGSGKSTLLRLIAGFAAPQRGEIRVDGVDIARLPPWQRRIGMVFQSYALWPHLSVRDNVGFGLVEQKLPRREIDVRVAEALELVGLGAHGERRPHELSGGQQQRVALARTVVTRPQVLLLDEPLSNLDKTLRVQMRRELLALQRRLGLTTIFVTHDQEEAMTTADRMAVLDHGVVQQVGTPMTLFDEPVNAFVAGFVGTMNLLPGRVRHRDGGPLVFTAEGVGELDLPAGGVAPSGNAALLSVRPHTLRLVAAGAARDAALVWLDGDVEAAEFLGESTRYQVRVGTTAWAVDAPHRAGAERLAAGTSVGVGLDPAQVRLLPG
ncbi:MAG: ABC transporter ATP-binding protein [Caldimonas sp.]